MSKRPVVCFLNLCMCRLPLLFRCSDSLVSTRNGARPPTTTSFGRDATTEITLKVLYLYTQNTKREMWSSLNLVTKRKYLFECKFV